MARRVRKAGPVTPRTSRPRTATLLPPRRRARWWDGGAARAGRSRPSAPRPREWSDEPEDGSEPPTLAVADLLGGFEDDSRDGVDRRWAYNSAPGPCQCTGLRGRGEHALVDLGGEVGDLLGQGRVRLDRLPLRRGGVQGVQGALAAVAVGSLRGDEQDFALQPASSNRNRLSRMNGSRSNPACRHRQASATAGVSG